MSNNIVFENRRFRLEVSHNCVAKSLIFKENGEELLYAEAELPLFSLSQTRPFNNEVKLAHMNKFTTYPGICLECQEDRLVVTFAEIPCKAVIRVVEHEDYFTFSLDSFIADTKDYPGEMDIPPVTSLRLLQLPFRHREKFGEWLNILSDNEISACVIATSPFELVDSEQRSQYRILYAEVRKDVKLLNTTAALMICSTDRFLEVMDGFEKDFKLPAGVASRNDPSIRQSILRVSDLSPENVDEYIFYAKKGGFKLMLVYYTAMCKEKSGYYLCSDYDYLDCYPERDNTLREVLAKVKAAGITPGLHFLHTHIGIESRYVTPVPDHRLGLKMHFTLAKPASDEDSVIYVEEDPSKAAINPKCRILRFGKELIYYDGFTTQRPYAFTGCQRGYWNTTASDHDDGTIGGLLDVSEFGGTSIYLDQNSSLQEEVAEKIAAIYNCGFEFAYFDGSEGTNVPYEYHISNAQYKVYSRMKKTPLFCEGAAKTHFSWHIITGGNAFDMFPDSIFKEKIVEFPFLEAQQLQTDYTRVNFGWWAYRNTTQPDIYEFGISRAAAWDCPTTVSIPSTSVLEENKRTEDNLEVIRRWEDIREKGILTDEQKTKLKNPTQEHILLINEASEYELVEYEEIQCDNNELRAFYFTRSNKNYVVCWHRNDKGRISLNLCTNAVYETELGKDDLPVVREPNKIILEVAGRRYFSAPVSEDELKTAFRNAVLFD